MTYYHTGNATLTDAKMAVQLEDRPARPGFYQLELHKVVWEVPVRYQDLSPIGTGAYGTVW